MIVFRGHGAEEQALVRFSDGEELHGELAPVAGSRLILHDGKHRRELQPEQLVEISVLIESEEMLRRWRFIEPGKPQKEETGQPRPLRNYRVSCLLLDGSRIEGHLQTMAFKLRAEEGSRKFLLAAQQKGKEGQGLDELVYPQLLRWPRSVAQQPVDARIEAPRSIGAVQELVALSRPDLARFEARQEQAGWSLPATAGAPLFLAARGEQGMLVTWPGEAAGEADQERFRAAIAEVDDFFDQRKLLGLWRDPADDYWYSLVLLQRQRKSTSVKPWRLTVWRWIEDKQDGRLQVAARMHLLRGLPQETAPGDLRCSAAWWQSESRCRSRQP